MLKFDLFNKFIDYLHGRDRQPDLAVGDADEQELAGNIETARNLNSSPLEPDPKFSKKLLNEMKMELREQTARRVKFPVWKINFRFGWMTYASAIMLAAIFFMWGVGQLNQVNNDMIEPGALAEKGPDASFQAPGDSPAARPDNPAREKTEKAAPGIVLAEKINDSAPARETPAAANIQDEPDDPAADTAPPAEESAGGSLALGEMPGWPAEFGQELNSLNTLMDDLESFGAGLNELETDLNNF